jgi:hypothetical protein
VVNIITRHSIVNYGSLLQAYALKTYLEGKGLDTCVLNYVPESEGVFGKVTSMARRSGSFGRSAFRRFVYFLLQFPEMLFTETLWWRRVGMTLRLTPKYRSHSQLEDSVSADSIYMVGSDQVWGSISTGNVDSAYMLSFCPKDVKKYVYAASIGSGNPQDEFYEYARKYLTDFRAISVRETPAQKTLETLGIHSDIVLDPVFLFDKQHYISRFNKPKKSGDKAKSSVVIYSVANPSILDSLASDMASKVGKCLIRVSPVPHTVLRSGKGIWSVRVDDFLACLNNADLILTNSLCLVK